MFKLHVEDLMSQLRARGAESQELITNLFKAYTTCEDEVFQRYIEQKQNDFDDGYALTEKEQIVALQAQLQKLEKTKKKATNDGNKSGNPKGDTNKKSVKKPDWMLKVPTPEEKKKGSHKTVSKKEYWWCSHHNCWARHKPSDCRAKKNKDSSGRSTPTDKAAQPTLEQKQVTFDDTADKNSQANDPDYD